MDEPTRHKIARAGVNGARLDGVAPAGGAEEPATGTVPELVLWALRHARVIERFEEHLRAWAEDLERLSRQAPEDVTTLMRYILTVVGEEARGLDVTPLQREQVLGRRDLAELDRWLRAAVTVNTVDELFSRT